MPGDLVLTVDMGTGSARAGVFSVGRNSALAVASRVSSISHPAPHRSEFDPSEWWMAVQDAMAEAVAKAGEPSSQYMGITVTSLRQGFLLLDEAQEPLGPGVLNYDRRGADYCDEITSRIPIHSLYELTGHWKAPELTLPKLLWFQSEQPDTWDQVAHFLFVHDWVLFRLCGKMATNSTMICAGQMADVAARDWARDLIASLGLPISMLPEVFEGGVVLGGLDPAVAAATGLAVDTPVHVGGGDTQFGCLGVGGMQPGSAVVVGGSTTPVMLTTEEPLRDPLRYPWVSTHLRPGRWAAETNAGHTGMIYRWFRDTLAKAEVEDAVSRGYGPYDTLNRLAAHAPVGAGGLLALAPNPRWAQDTWQRKAPYSFFNLQLSHDIGHMARAIMESVCYGVRGNVEQLQRAAGREFDELLFTGGISAVPFWAQMMADVVGQPVHVPEVREASVVAGAQLVLWGGGGDEDLERPPHTTYEPNLGRAGEYDQYFHRYVGVFEKMQEYFGE